MGASRGRLAALAALAVWVCAGCHAGGDAARVDASALVGTWSNADGARLRLDADHGMAGEGLYAGVLGGASCPDAAVGQWRFFSTLDEAGGPIADGPPISGDQIVLMPAGVPETMCQLSALIRRDEQGVNLCLVEDPDSDCSSEEELLRLEPVR